MKSLLFTTAFTCLYIFSLAQTPGKPLVVTGKIISASGDGIGSVSVLIKGRRGGTMTLANGVYTLKNAKDGDLILFTHQAYKPVSVLIKGNNVVNVSMDRATLSFPVFSVIDTVEASSTIVTQDEAPKYFLEKVEINPAPRGGFKALSGYLDSTVHYPEAAKKKNIEGEVIIGFVVGKEGQIKDARVIKGISADCDEVALTAVKGMRPWVQAIQNGRSIESYVELPVQFTLIKRK